MKDSLPLEHAKMTFGKLYLEALVPGRHGEWREACFRAMLDGIPLKRVLLASDLAYLTQIGSVVVVCALISLVSTVWP